MIKEIKIRPYRQADEADVIQLWKRCNLIVPQNDPADDIARKIKVQPELFLVGVRDDRIIASVMAGYEGHRGWINYLAVDPDFRRQGIGRFLMGAVEKELRKRGCPKINLQVRKSNAAVIKFYERIGFTVDDVVGLGKKLN